MSPARLVLFVLCCWAVVIGVVWLLITAAPARAHSWYFDQSNPDTHYGCCGDRDCVPLTYEQFSENANEYIMIVDELMAAFLVTKPGRYSIPKKQALPARGWKKGETGYHGCIWGGQLKCFFYPAGS